MDGVVEYLDQEDYTEEYTQVCRNHGYGKKWRGIKIQRFIEWGTKDEDSDQMIEDYKKVFGIQRKTIRRCNSKLAFLGETKEEEQKEDTAKTARTIQHDDSVQYTVQDGRPAVDGFLTHWEELAKANEREEMWPFAHMH